MIVFTTGKRKWTNLDKKFTIHFKVDHSTSNRYVLHHTVLLQLKKTVDFREDKKYFFQDYIKAE